MILLSKTTSLISFKRMFHVQTHYVTGGIICEQWIWYIEYPGAQPERIAYIYQPTPMEDLTERHDWADYVDELMTKQFTFPRPTEKGGYNTGVQPLLRIEIKKQLRRWQQVVPS